MANVQYSIILIAVSVLGTLASSQLIAPRLINGVPIDTLRRFPHHVTIQREILSTVFDNRTLCGGSILNDQWILTSARCVGDTKRLSLHFEKLYLNSTKGSYSAVVNCDVVQIYPTYYDDIALVKLPFRLLFSDTIKPVTIGTATAAQLENKLAVLPGFDVDGLYEKNQQKELTYAMLNIIPNSKCKQYDHAGEFDEYLQFCTEAWGNSNNTPCVTDHGSGLLVGWPGKTELVGIYSSTSNDCNSGTPSVYTNVARYARWIDSVINSNNN